MTDNGICRNVYVENEIKKRSFLELFKGIVHNIFVKIIYHKHSLSSRKGVIIKMFSQLSAFSSSCFFHFSLNKSLHDTPLFRKFHIDLKNVFKLLKQKYK